MEANIIQDTKRNTRVTLELVLDRIIKNYDSEFGDRVLNIYQLGSFS